MLFFHRNTKLGAKTLPGFTWYLRIVLIFFFPPEVTEKEEPGFSRPGQPACGRTQALPPFLSLQGSRGAQSWSSWGRPFESHDTALTPTEAQKGGSGEGLILPPPSS